MSELTGKKHSLSKWNNVSEWCWGLGRCSRADLLKKSLPLEENSLLLTSQKYCHADEDYHCFFAGFAMHSCWLFFST
jgi:hypothetical protein